MAVEFYVDNWLVGAGAVGLLKVLESNGLEIGMFVEGRKLRLSEEVWENLPLFYADRLLKEGEETVKRSIVKLSGKKKEEGLKNPYNQVVLSKLGDFYKNSILTNPSGKHVKKVEEENKKLVAKYGSLEKLLERWEEYWAEVSKLIREAIHSAFGKIMNGEEDEQGPLCFFCRSRRAYKTDKGYKTFSAENFTPLSASPETVNNFFYNGINSMYLCKECELLLYFARFGFTKVLDKYLFVYTPESLEGLLSINRRLESKGWLSVDVIKESVLSVIKEVEPDKAYWTLENIYVVEIQPVSEATSNIYTFSIPPHVARVLASRIEKYPKSLDGLFDLFLDYVYQGKSLYEFVHYILSGFLYGEGLKKKVEDKTPTGRLLRWGTERGLGGLLFLIKFQEELAMQEQDKDIRWAYMEGKKLLQAYKESLKDDDRVKKKVSTISYRLLEAVRRKDENYFSQNIIRAYLEVEKPVPSVFLSALKGGLERVAYAFLIGLNAGEKEDVEGTSE